MNAEEKDLSDINTVDHLIYSYSHYDNGGSKEKTLGFIDGMLELAVRFDLSAAIIGRLREKRKYIESLSPF